MAALICSGTQFSGWQHISDRLLAPDSNHTSISAELSALSRNICRDHFPETDDSKLWPLAPDEKYLATATDILARIKNMPVFPWSDYDSNLFLNFWKSVDKNARFLLFYASPEYELSRYFETNGFNEEEVEQVVDAWMTRTLAMFTFYMSNRETCLLVNVESSFSSGHSLILKLEEKFGFELNNDQSVNRKRPAGSAALEYIATTLLLNRYKLSALYNDLRSAATVLCAHDEAIVEIEDRSKALINPLLQETQDLKQETQDLKQENELQRRKANEQQKINMTLAEYVKCDPVLKLARQARQVK